jgi:hypothetical protein
MASGTEGFTDVSGSVNPIGSVISKILAARAMAEEEREYAEKVAEANQTSLDEAGVEKGFFFKQALAHEFGGDYIGSKKEDLDNFVNRAKLLKNPKQNFWDIFKKQEKKTKGERFRAKFDYSAEIDDPMLRPRSPITQGSAKKVQKATRGSGKNVSKEQLLTTLTDLVQSLQSISDSINKTTQESSDGIKEVAQAQNNLAEQLKYRTSSLEDKLDRIAEAISNQTQFQKQSVDKAEDVASERKLEKISDLSSTEKFDDLETPEDESKKTGWEHIALPGVPEAETGGIISGPDSGYLAKLHGDEMVIPLDNRFTRGQPSAMDGKVRPKPYTSRTQTFEKGSATPGIEVTSPISPNIVNLGGSLNQYQNENLMKAMEVSMQAVGGGLLSSTAQYLKSVGGEPGISSEVTRLMRPIAAVFGLSPSFTNVATRGASTKKTTEEEEDGGEKKGLYSKMLEAFKSMLDGVEKAINTAPRNPSNPRGSNTLIPGDAPPEIKALMETISGGEGGPDSIQGFGAYPGLSDMTIDEALAVANQKIDAGESSTGALGAYQFHSSFLRKRAMDAGFDPATDKFSLENQTKIMRHFMTSVWTAGGGQGGEQGLIEALQAGNLESEVFPKLSKDLGWPSLPGGSQPNVHTPGAAGRYQENLEKYQAAPPSPNTPPVGDPSATGQPTGLQSSQDITDNYGLKTNEKFDFTHNGQSYEAYKTTRGFDIFKKGVINQKLDTSGGKNSAVVEALIKAGEARIAPPTRTEPPAKQDPQASLQRPDKSGAGSSSIAMLNTTGSTVSSGSQSLPGGDVFSIDKGIPDPAMRDLYPTGVISA